MHKALLASSAAPIQMSVQNQLFQGVPALQPPLPPALSSSSTSTIASSSSSSSISSSVSPSSLQPINQALSTQINNHSSATGISSSAGLTSLTVSSPETMPPQPSASGASAAPAAAVAVAAAAAAQAQAHAAFMAAGAGHPNLPGISHHGAPSPNPMQHALGLSMNGPHPQSAGFCGVPTLYSHPSMIPSSPQQPGLYIPNSVVNSPTLSPHNISFSTPRHPFLPGFGPGAFPIMGQALTAFPGAPPPPPPPHHPHGPQFLQTIPQSSQVPSTMLVGDINTLKKQQQALTGKMRPGVFQQNGLRSKFSPY